MSYKDKNLIKVIGSGGKGGSSDPFEADDNMFARQHAAFIDVIGEGPIKGLVYGDASILVDETRMRDVNQLTGARSGVPNIKNFRPRILHDINSG
jgi:predicted phage tail protein